MLSLLSSRKAQFFVLSAVAIVTIIFFVSRWLEPYTIPDTSFVALSDESFVFDNIVEKFKETVKTSKTCEDLKYNLDEFKNFAERFASEKNYILDIHYTISPCADEPPPMNAVVEAKIYLESSQARLYSEFSVTRP